MHRLLAALCCVACFVLPCAAAELPGMSKLDPNERKLDGAVHYNEGRMLALPDGQAKLYLTLILPDNWQNDRRYATIAGWFNTDARLASIASSTHFNIFPISNPLFRDRMRAYLGTNVPICTAQLASGKVLYNVTATSFPTSSTQLANELVASLETTFAPQITPQMVNDLAGPCPGPGPCPAPNPYDAQPLPALIPEHTPRTSYVGVVIGVILVGLVAVSLALVCYLTGRKPDNSKTTCGLWGM